MTSPLPRLASFWSFVKERYATLDARSLGAFRIAFGAVLLADLAYRYRGLDTWYTNDGLLPNHVVLWAPTARVQFSLFFSVSTHGEAVLAFAFCFVVFISYLVGLKTRLCQVLALVCIVSLNSRISALENGGDMVVNILCLLTLFLPLGRRFSLDAWLKKLAMGEPRTTEPTSCAPAQPQAGSYTTIACSS
jgi:hypothetical protein